MEVEQLKCLVNKLLEEINPHSLHDNTIAWIVQQNKTSNVRLLGEDGLGTWGSGSHSNNNYVCSGGQRRAVFLWATLEMLLTQGSKLRTAQVLASSYTLSKMAVCPT